MPPKPKPLNSPGGEEQQPTKRHRLACLIEEPLYVALKSRANDESKSVTEIVSEILKSGVNQ